MSDTFSLNLPAGSYYVGGIADVAGDWTYNNATVTANGITSTDVNGNVANYASPVLNPFSGFATIAVQVYGTPEPASLAVIGLAASGLLRRRRSA